ncbi:hypothetical protein COCSUDRAFT_53024 [Coccomyxa subellipsoidea C-169]|uniref:Uncharacterized protein n=1 Tax=Coccomyxa subellipsoidea (strain C-169) TaxID=574566 RepID=I0Z1X5_COCSC|nr:hypothetical protein COCSUDRAFT_53024 [Coccomyxa subellipsoidea C-169]EIE24644.1 hypothetical protein COCSUDRAFT_53024 [Coccomyxa subellipsoidea C-169]|eukprot:XP_005649188.1 hypothetical protein COCSUDRAFT_53024 [Coccomyxa subellipsoidea C-169]
MRVCRVLAAKRNVGSSQPEKQQVWTIPTILTVCRVLAIPVLIAGNDWVLPVISSVIIGREIAMSALRELAASLGGEAYSAVAVSSWGKWKTATQTI